MARSTGNPGDTGATPAARLAAFLERFEPSVAALARAALARLRKRLPGAVELVYDNYNALVIGFGPSDRASEALFSIAVYPRWVSLFFANGPRLPDPAKLLRGTGTRVRHIVLGSASELESSEIEALIAATLKLASRPLDGSQKRTLIIKSVSAKQRPRRVMTRSKR